MEGFNIFALNGTNEDVIIVYTPSFDVTNYSYAIIKNGVKGDTVNISNNSPISITLTDDGVYNILITLNTNGVVGTISSGEYVIDNTAPVINVKKKTYKIKENETVDVLNGVTAYDNNTDITDSITTNMDSIDLSTTGIKTVEYTACDNAGNCTTSKAYITVKKDYTNLIRVGQISFIIVLFLIFVFIYRYIRSMKLEKRFSKYTINSKKNTSTSLFDILYNKYIDLISIFSNSLSKSKLIKNKATGYIKYNIAFNLDDPEGIKFVARKIFLGIIYALILFIIGIIRSNLINVFELIIPFILGYYTLDVIYYYRYYKYRKQIENDLLEAITVMNNAFKVGMSIIQAIELVTKELDGPISREFKKISTELSYGIEIETVFKRFADRIKINEAVYLTSSLSVLNKTGGNITKVFDSIKKTMYNKKKLEQELKSLTSSSRFIMWVLIFVPVIFVLTIMAINPGYFKPLVSGPIGYSLIVIMILIYVSYIFIVKRIMKVRM